MRRIILGSLAAVTLITAAVYSAGTGGLPVRIKPELAIKVEAVNPWNNLDMRNDPDQFQFAIVTDRTGGHREGIFTHAVAELNMMQPQFVVSVGDLIEGGTEDRDKLESEWSQFNGFVKQLRMPFFYVPGNHDISNLVMQEEWGKRFGRSYYYFIYRGVLFLILNTEDPPGSKPASIGSEQREFALKVLAENPDARWTLVFLHRPVWTYAEETGWAEIESALQGRSYTVFAGHNHNYMRYTRNGMHYYRLATTGGASKLRGTEQGEFDHFVWVTMTPDGPRLANVLLGGVLPEDVRVE